MLIQSALVALAATMVGAVPPLEIRGTDFVNPKTGDKFQIVGMAYQPGGASAYDPSTGKDPLSHHDECIRDAALMQAAGVNAIRVYNLDPNINHDDCASIFNAAGIYMILDVNSPLQGESLNRDEPWTTYHKDYLKRAFAIVEAFGNYPNTLLFFSGNEVIDKPDSAKHVPPYLRAVTRDLKNYIKKNLKRSIPVGYSAADVREILWDTWNYVQCAEDGKADDMSRVDVFALNSYSWCKPEDTFETSTFSILNDGFKKSSVPVLFSEYGCITSGPRLWNETRAIYSEMAGVFSGGVAYEWTQEANSYGLVEVNGSEVKLSQDYDRLKAQWAQIDWKKVQSQPSSKSTVTPPECDSDLIKEDQFNGNFTIPPVPAGVQKMIDNGISPKPRGKIVKISDFNVKMTVKDSSGNTVDGLKVIALNDDEFNWSGKNKASTSQKDGGSGSSNGDKEDAAVLTKPFLWAAALPLVAMLFA